MEGLLRQIGLDDKTASLEDALNQLEKDSEEKIMKLDLEVSSSSLPTMKVNVFTIHLIAYFGVSYAQLEQFELDCDFKRPEYEMSYRCKNLWINANFDDDDDFKAFRREKGKGWVASSTSILGSPSIPVKNDSICFKFTYSKCKSCSISIEVLTQSKRGNPKSRGIVWKDVVKRTENEVTSRVTITSTHKFKILINVKLDADCTIQTATYSQGKCPVVHSTSKPTLKTYSTVSNLVTSTLTAEKMTETPNVTNKLKTSLSTITPTETTACTFSPTVFSSVSTLEGDLRTPMSTTSEGATTMSTSQTIENLTSDSNTNVFTQSSFANTNMPSSTRSRTSQSVPITTENSLSTSFKTVFKVRTTGTEDVTKKGALTIEDLKMSKSTVNRRRTSSDRIAFSSTTKRFQFTSLSSESTARKESLNTVNASRLTSSTPLSNLKSSLNSEMPSSQISVAETSPSTIDTKRNSPKTLPLSTARKVSPIPVSRKLISNSKPSVSRLLTTPTKTTSKFGASIRSLTIRSTVQYGRNLSDKRKKKNTEHAKVGMVSGLVFGVICLLAVIIVITVIVVKRRKQQRKVNSPNGTGRHVFENKMFDRTATFKFEDVSTV